MTFIYMNIWRATFNHSDKKEFMIEAIKYSKLQDITF